MKEATLRERIEGLDRAGLLELSGLIEERLTEDLGAVESPNEGHASPKCEGSPPLTTGRPRGRRWVELKIINGCGPYAYERWIEGGRKRSRYLGKAEEVRA